MTDVLVVIGPILGFLLIIILMAVLYAKRWCCFAVRILFSFVKLLRPPFQCRSDMPEPVDQMSNNDYKGWWKTQVHHKVFKVNHKKPPQKESTMPQEPDLF